MNELARSGKRHVRLSALIAAAGLVALLLVHRIGFPIFDGIEGTTLDWRFQFRGAVAPPPDVVIIAVDERALAEVGRWPLPRAKIAAAIDRLHQLGARSIGVDLLLSEPEGPSDGQTLSAGDLAVREALQREGRCVLAMAALFEPSAVDGLKSLEGLSTLGYHVVQRPASGGFEPQRASDALLPIEPFRHVAVVGHVNLASGGAGARRSFQPAIAIGDVLIPSFSVQLAQLQLGLDGNEVALSLEGWLQLGERKILLDNDMSAPIDYYGPAGSIATYSLADLMKGAVPPNAIAGRAVLLGGTAVGLGDQFTTPFARELPGVELLATITANLLHGPQLVRTGAMMRAWEFGAILALAGLAWITANLRNPRLALLLTGVVIALWPAVTLLAFMRWHLWLNMTVPTIAAVMTGAIVVLGRVAEELRLRREAERQRSNLARYLPAAMAPQLAAEDKPGFYEREQLAAILFVDLSGFTHLSETRSPGETARFLKEFHGKLEEVVLAHGGVIEQFTGDGAMVIFGLPQPKPEDPVAALACARALVNVFARWQPGLVPRAGLHFGPVAMARLGGATQSQLAAAGDIVNVASRLEAFAKQRDMAIAVSDSVMTAVAAVGRGDLQAGFRALADQPIRGRQGRVTVWIASLAALAEGAGP
jgi:adenylate cyclase